MNTDARIFTVGDSPFTITLRVQETNGRGLNAFVTGGTSPHVGGVALAVPRDRSDGKGLTCDVSQLCVPGHKDVEAAALVAKALALGVHQVVCVTAGIHVDNASGDDIALLMQNALSAVEVYLNSRA